MGFKIITWNINGLRSFGGRESWRKIFQDFDKSDIVCFQETKISRANMQDWMFLIDGYTSYFAFPDMHHSNNSMKSGYSGVASFCREDSGCRPWAIEVSLLHNTKEIFDYDSFDETNEDSLFWTLWPNLKSGDDLLLTSWNQIDLEGRCIVSKHRMEILNSDEPQQQQTQPQWLHVFNLYCPRNDPTRSDRAIFQLKFYHLVQKRVQDLLMNPANHVMIVGDLNVAHQSIDVYSDEEFCYVDSYSRKWLNQLLDGQKGIKLVDAFRKLHPLDRKAFTCWNTKFGARETNYGSRIDYIIIDEVLSTHLVECRHLDDYRGSDHCPVMAQFDDRIRFIPPSHFNEDYSSHCTKFWIQNERNTIRKYFSEHYYNQKEKKEVSNESLCIVNARSNKKAKSDCQTKISAFLTGVKKISMKEEKEKTTPETDSREPIVSATFTQNSDDVSEKWRQLFNNKKTVPYCSGHQLQCVRQKVKKPGINFGREFYQCSKPALKPEGHPETKCNFFQWVSTRETSKPG